MMTTIKHQQASADRRRINRDNANSNLEFHLSGCPYCASYMTAKLAAGKGCPVGQNLARVYLNASDVVSNPLRHSIEAHSI